MKRLGIKASNLDCCASRDNYYDALIVGAAQFLVIDSDSDDCLRTNIESGEAKRAQDLGAALTKKGDGLSASSRTSNVTKEARYGLEYCTEGVGVVS